VLQALLAEAKSGGESGPLFVEGVALALASRLARRFGTPAHGDDGAGLVAARLAAVLDRIEDTLAERITIEELAGFVGTSAAHFAREFRRLTQKTPHQFIVQRRLERARRLLLAGRPIRDVAIECGFADQAHLTRVFKQRFGVTPAAAPGRPRRTR
jgi:AraC family transcriptional regulator